MRTVLALCLFALIGCASLPKATLALSAGSPIAAQPSPAPAPAAAPPRAPFPFQAVAIFTAIGIFLAREVLEARRRHIAKKRQLAALKANLARQCEFNNWSYQTLTRALKHVGGSLELNDGDVHKLTFLRNGGIRLTTFRNERGHAGMMLPKVRVAEFEDRIMQAAELDAELQSLTDEATAESAEMLHVRDSLITHLIEEDDDVEMPDGILLDFTRYGLEQLDRTYDALNKLYVYCTGNQLTAHRLR